MADRCRSAARCRLALCVAFVAVAPAASAAVKDYQILRLLSDRTVCQTEGLERKANADGSIVFHATCGNVTFYPDGIEIVCADPEDERSCQLKTQQTKFDQLELLRRK